MTAAELRQALAALPPDAVLTLPVHELRAALGAEPTAPAPREVGPGHLLTAVDVARRLGVSERWVYDHGDQLGVRRLSRRCVRFPEAAVVRYLARR
jgi:hypothetical protein